MMLFFHVILMISCDKIWCLVITCVLLCHDVLWCHVLWCHVLLFLSMSCLITVYILWCHSQDVLEWCVLWFQALGSNYQYAKFGEIWIFLCNYGISSSHFRSHCKFHFKSEQGSFQMKTNCPFAKVNMFEQVGEGPKWTRLNRSI